ncbi:MAG: hypothetical protein RDU59_11910 [Thermodesulfobacteriota bacterium]|nr:hypothetical protein [Thermodesulfobacteriota bacterium]
MGNQVWVNINLEFEFHASRKVKHQILLSKDFISFLAKQVVLYCSQTGTQLNELDLANLLFKYGNLETDLNYVNPAEEDSWLWVLRATNHQWSYLRLPSSILGRYVYLFERVFADNDLKREINQSLNISLFDLLRIGFSILAGFAVSPDGRLASTSFEISRYTNTQIEALKPLLTQENLNKFFDIFATDKKHFCEANKQYRLASPLLKKYEFNPLKRYPIIITDSDKDNEKYIIPSLADFLYATTEGLYYVLLDKLQEEYKAKLFRLLGEAFETYVGELITFYNLDLFSRARLIGEQTYRVGRNQVRSADWLLVSDQTIFQIECKKRKLNSYAKAGVESKDGKGIKAFLKNVAEGLDKFYKKEDHIRQGLLNGITYGGQKFINIIVYLDEMFSLNQYGRNEIRKHMKNERDDFYILGCWEFELLCQHSKNKTLNLERALRDLMSNRTEIYYIEFLDNIYNDFFDGLTM